MTDSPVPVSASAPAAPLVLTPLGWRDPFRWLARGLRDMAAAPGIALFYGGCFWLMALVLGWVFRASPEYTMSLVSGCLLVGPFLAMGLYETSRRREAGLPPQLGESITCWDSHMGSMGMLVLVLVVLELLWGRASLVVFAVFFNTGMPSTTGVVQAIFNPGNWQFIAVYLLVGGVFAALVFSSTVVSIPMILDRDTDALTAGIASVRVVLENPGVMLLWGALIAALVVLSLWWTWGAGLLVVGPVLGHASWHAYRAAVAAPRAAEPAVSVPPQDGGA
ncbi:hypothetical protein ALDI51_26020 [Alicycliphilus denitrificans]|uniref:DUF2189 domain-containing protein n=1 Tax=Alicycliphilus denitrificans TaxID=179636 RepID=UPI00095FB6B7|nr:DUF2189 domain-containing protein [Alicycliphilus denitrificans]MBN9572830.1 DUF2189 domain-containing protein [Alicycliphilus denitrificans]OJW91055.1 MAG: hypothetical protein BGO66_11575 [Alicycliphilus sp. 69-12]BCN39283.1 hypothetical protein ALDI51_26020 [Alicycliphilus denitrificans]